jgi:hypothetical protein
VVEAVDPRVVANPVQIRELLIALTYVGDRDRFRGWRVLRLARELALTPAQVISLLAGTAYDLRHGGLSLWFNAGVPATEVAQRAGNSVEVLLAIYAKCIYGDEEIVNKRIERALRGESR